MPPFLPRKRLRSSSPLSGSSNSKEKSKTVTSNTLRKPTLFAALDAGTSSRHTAEKTRNILAKLAGSDEEESDLSSLSSPECDFEDVPKLKRRKIQKNTAWDKDKDEDEDENEEEDIVFEDVHT